MKILLKNSFKLDVVISILEVLMNKENNEWLHKII